MAEEKVDRPQPQPQPQPQLQLQQKSMSHQEFMKDPYFAKWYPKWINNSMEVYPTIKKEFETRDHCISCLPRPMNRPCMILGSGPSLDKMAPYLKDWKHPIFSSTSTAFVPRKWGRTPEYMCAFDSLWSTYNEHLMLDKKISWEGTTLLTHPNAEPKMIESWKWDKYYYRRVFPGHEFFELTFPLMFPWIKIGVRFSGCVANNSLTLAAFLGFNPIVIAGVDFGWQDDTKTKGTNWRPVKGDWIKDPDVPVDTIKYTLVIDDNNGTHTHPHYYGFKSGLLSIYASNPNINIVDCSNGIINEFPKVEIGKMIETQGWGDYGVNRIESIEKINTFFQNLNNGRFEWQQEEKKQL